LRLKLTGVAILVSRRVKVLQAAPAAYPYRSATEASLLSSAVVRSGGTMHKFVLLFCVVAFVTAPVCGEEKADAPVGRYQVVPVTPEYFAVIDTTTGECWVEDGDRWIDLRFPTKDTKVIDGKVGRFRLDALRSKLGGNLKSLVVCDTTDGRCWRADYLPASMEWQAHDSPRKK
jgi:hypothetical protein